MQEDNGSGCSWGTAVLGALRSSLPRSDLPGCKQATPLSLNRYVLLFIYVFQTFMTGCVYFGWAPLSSMLLRAEVFSFKCESDGQGGFVDDQRAHGHSYICDEQDASVQSLFVITLAVHCTMSALAGTMMDTLGPKITSVTGQCLHIIGWSLISSFTPSSHAAVYLGFIFIGLGADTAFLPTLLITRLFPGSAATVITVIGSASSASFAIPLVLNNYLTHNGISGCWWYVCFGPGMFLLIDALVMPLRAYKVYEADIPTSHQVVPVEPARGSLEGPQLVEQETGEFSVELKANTAESGKGREMAEEPALANADGRTFMKTLFSEKYLLVVVYFIGVGWVTSFYQEAHDRILVPTAQDFLGKALPFSFIPCVILGKLSECIGILPVMGIVNTAGALAYLFSLKLTAATGIISVLWFMVYMSLFVSQVFVYIEGTFPARFFGRLIGVVQLVGGLLALLCSPLFSLTVGLGPNGLYVVQVPIICLLIAMYAVIARMWWLGKKTVDLDKTERVEDPSNPVVSEPAV